MLFKRGFDPCLKNRGQSRALLPFSLPKSKVMPQGFKGGLIISHLISLFLLISNKKNPIYEGGLGYYYQV